MFVVFRVEADECGDGSDFWLGGLGVKREAGKGEDRGYGEALHWTAPEKDGMTKYSVGSRGLGDRLGGAKERLTKRHSNVNR